VRTGRPNPNIVWIAIDNDIQTVNVQAVVFKRSRFKLSLYKPGAGSRTWRERPAWKHGHWNILMVLMKASIAQVRSPKFSTAGHYQSGPLQMRSARTDGESKFAAWLFLSFIVACRWNRVKPAPAFDKISVSQPLALPGQRFVARQPIFDRSQNVYGYEILFRNGVENFFNADPELRPGPRWIAPCYSASIPLRSQACLHELHPGSLIQGSNYLAASRPDRGRDSESVEPEDRVIAACKRLRAAGYRIALDDFAPDDPRIPLSSLPTSSKSTFAPPGLRNELA